MTTTKFDPMRLPEPDSLGFFMHPDVPGEEEDDDVAAMFSVAALVREMEDDGLVRYASTSYSTGYVLTSKGRIAATELRPTKNED